MTINWIDINKSLPPYDGVVLLCVEIDQTHTPPRRRLALGARVSTTRDGEQFDVSGYVTHWASRPELPAR